MTTNDSPDAPSAGPPSLGPLPEQPQIHDSMLDLIGNTPLVRLHSLAPETGADWWPRWSTSTRVAQSRTESPSG